MHKKDFEKWNKKKRNIHQENKAPFCHEREIWWCTLGLNIGFEQDGSGEEFRRPILVLKSFSAQTCLVIPLTTAPQDHPMRPSIGLVDGKMARVLLSQMRVIDTRRLVRKIGFLEVRLFEFIQKAAKDLL
jgi:mRNA-degrading endonuclease toxin of MazEF toxin-antitoxin module